MQNWIREILNDKDFNLDKSKILNRLQKDGILKMYLFIIDVEI